MNFFFHFYNSKYLQMHASISISIIEYTKTTEKNIHLRWWKIEPFYCQLLDCLHIGFILQIPLTQYIIIMYVWDVCFSHREILVRLFLEKFIKIQNLNNSLNFKFKNSLDYKSIKSVTHKSDKILASPKEYKIYFYSDSQR